jgi:TRAP-type C4-dicarboxylate transport system permease small subunit
MGYTAAIRMLRRTYELVPGIMLLVCALLTLLDVAGRNLLNAPLRGATEVTEILLVGIVFLLFPRIAWRDSHLAVDLLDSVLGRVVRRVMAVLAALLATGLFAAMAYRLWFLAERLERFGDVTPSLRLPISPVYTAMAVLAALTAAILLVRALALVIAPRLVFLDGAGGQKVGID